MHLTAIGLKLVFAATGVVVLYAAHRGWLRRRRIRGVLWSRIDDRPALLEDHWHAGSALGANMNNGPDTRQRHEVAAYKHFLTPGLPMVRYNFPERRDTDAYLAQLDAERAGEIR